MREVNGEWVLTWAAGAKGLAIAPKPAPKAGAAVAGRAYGWACVNINQLLVSHMIAKYASEKGFELIFEQFSVRCQRMLGEHQQGLCLD